MEESSEKISENFKKDSKDVKNDSNDVKKDSKDVKKDSKEDVKKDSKDVKKDSKDAKKDSKDVKKDSKDVKKESKDVKKDSKDVKKDLKVSEKEDVKKEQKTKELEKKESTVKVSSGKKDLSSKDSQYTESIPASAILEDEESEKKKRRGPVGKLLFKVGERIGIVEQTRLAPEFVTEIEKYYKYQEDIDSLVDKLENVLQNDESVLQQGNIECAENNDPYEILAHSIKAFRPLQHENVKETLITAEAVVKRLAIMNREMQIKGRRSIRKMRRFVAQERVAMIEAQKKLMQARDIMDAARHEALKQTRTTDMVEEKGKFYERMVIEFDQQAARVAAFPEHLDVDKEEHQKELFNVRVQIFASCC
ncbi:unnamed protein product [Thelazia callipaeda]|uniref:BAR domain-containing protein n=1 Tax=Thelazia callipaeda TaxID=103827 RepID=A0A0N5D8P4_THECL|nr:unnamed protein product [Thelazia callipaeda]